MLPYARALRPNHTIDTSTEEGARLLSELRAFFDGWDSSEQVEVEPIPSWEGLAEVAGEAGLVDIAAVIPAIRGAMRVEGAADHARTDIVRWVRAHIAIATGKAVGPVEHLADHPHLLGGMHINDWLQREEDTLLASLPVETAETRASDPCSDAGVAPGDIDEAFEPDPDIPF